MSDHEDDIYGPRLGPWQGTGELVREDEQSTVARAAAIVDLIDAGPGDGRIEIHSGSPPTHAGEPVREGDPAHVAACDYGAGPEHGVVFLRAVGHNGGTGRVLYLRQRAMRLPCLQQPQGRDVARPATACVW